MECNIQNGAIRWRISTSVKIICRVFVIALTVYHILKFHIFDLDNFVQGHGKQHS